MLVQWADDYMSEVIANEDKKQKFTTEMSLIFKLQGNRFQKVSVNKFYNLVMSQFHDLEQECFNSSLPE